jgi:hypothetical protein
MVTIKRPAKKPRSTGCNILIVLLLAQVLAAVVFFTWGSKHEALPASQDMKDRLDQSVYTLRKASQVPPAVVLEDKVKESQNTISSHDLQEKAEFDGQDEKNLQADDGHVENEKSKPSEDKLVGTHAAANYYFADFAYERENPSFRHASVADWDDSHDKIIALKPNLQIRSCQYKSDDHSVLFHATCRKEGTKLIAYNSAHFERSWCGLIIPPGAAVEIPKYCDEPVKLFQKDSPPVDGRGMPPIQVTSTREVPPTATFQDIACDIGCKVQQATTGDERYVQGTDWKIIQTMNDPLKHDNAKVERTSFRQDLYYSTTSFKSSVPLSFFSFDEYDIFAPAIDFDKVDASGSYLVDSLCASHFTKRNRWASAVEEQFPVKNYGKCAHNTDLPAKLKLYRKEDRIELLKKHRFNLAFEFGDAKDHISPQVWEALSSGTLVVILGAQNVKDHLPPDSFVSASGLQKWADLGTLVANIAKNKTEWQNYQTWRTNVEYKRQFEERYNFTRTSAECRLCRWAYAKRYGLGWSHQHQYVHEALVDRKLCLDDATKLISNPFKESWHKVTNGETTSIYKGVKTSTCGVSSDTLMLTNNLEFKRSVSFHDNVIDLVLSEFVKNAPGNDVVLRLELPVFNTEGSYFPNPHVLVSTTRGAVASSLSIQDSKSKVIVLASWHTEITSAKEGVVEVVIRKGDEELPHEQDETRRIRIIIEDMVELYDKATEFYPTSFAKLHVQDFVDPLELFYIED